MAPTPIPALARVESALDDGTSSGEVLLAVLLDVPPDVPLADVCVNSSCLKRTTKGDAERVP